MANLMHPLSWRRALALTFALALAACSKGQGDQAAAGADDPAAVAHEHEHEHGAAVLDPPAKPHGGHQAAHGGYVFMDSDHHVELVLDPATGKHRAYVSDGARTPMPASTFDQVSLTIAGEPLAMTRAADDASWEASGKPVPTTGVKVTIGYGKGGQEVARFADLPIEYVLTGIMPGAAPAAAEHGDGHHHEP